MSYDRRTLLKYMAGTSAAGMLAGCGGGGKKKTTTEGGGPVNTPTTLPPQTETEGPGQTEGPGGTTAKECSYKTVKPTVSDGSFALWHARTPAASKLLQGTKSLFQQYGPKVKLSRFPSGFLNKLRTSIPAGQGPQQFMWAHDLAGEFEQSGLVVDQSDKLRVDSCVYTESAWNATQYNGKTIGLPWAGESPALVYNKKILNNMGTKPPETMDEMISIMDEFQNRSKGKFGLSMPVNTYFVSWAAQAYGAEIYNGEKDKLGHEDPALAKGLRLVTEKLSNYMPSDPAYGAQVAAFNDGVAPFMINGPWTIPSLKDNKKVDAGVKPIPKPEGGTPRPYMGVKLCYFAKKMGKDNQAAKVSREFAEWYTTSNTRMLNLANNAGFVPVKANLANHPNLPPLTKGFAKQLQTGYPMPQNPKMNQVWGPTKNAILEAFNTDKDIEPLLANAAKKIRNAWKNQ